MVVDWNNLQHFKIGVIEDSKTKNLVVRILIIQRILLKYRNRKNWIRLYTEFPITENEICDVYFEDIKNKEVYAYKIYQKISQDEALEISKFYKNYGTPYFNEIELITISLDKLDNDIYKLRNQIDDLIR